MKSISQENVTKFKRLGYLVVRNVFSKKEIDELRDSLRNLCEEFRYEGRYSIAGDLLNHEEIGRFVYDERMVEIAKALLGDEIVYYGDSGFAYSAPPSRGFHPDDPLNVSAQLGDRFRPRHMYESYGLIRLGIFPQDHTKHSAGIKFREQTHMYVPFPQFLRLLAGSAANYVRQSSTSARTKRMSRPFPSINIIRRCKMVNIKSQIGDVIVWDLRTLHSPWAVRLKIFSNFCLAPNIEKHVPRFLEMHRPENRSRLTVNYAAPSKFLDNQMKYLGSRPDYAEKHWDGCTWNKEEMSEFLHKKGLGLNLDCFDYREGKDPEIVQ